MSPTPETTIKETATSAMQPEYFFWGAVLVACMLFLNAPSSSAPGNTTVAAVAGALEGEPAVHPFDSVDLIAKAAAVYDATTHTFLFEKNATTSLPLASVTKVMTGTLALSLVPETTILTISDDAIRQEGDSHLSVGEKWVLRDLLTFMLLESSNDSAYAVSSSVGAVAKGVDDLTEGRDFFIAEMNRSARERGLTATVFRSESGLDVSTTTAGALSSAADTTKMLAEAIELFPHIFTETRLSALSIPNEEGVVRDARNTNHSIDKLPLLIASKTGYTDLAGGNLVIAFNAGFNHPIIIAVLGSTVSGRFEDVEKLVWATLDSLQAPI